MESLCEKCYMKKILLNIPIILFTIFAIAGCLPNVIDELSLSSHEIELSNSPADEYMIKIESTSTWLADVSSNDGSDWIIVSPVYGEEGTSLLKITVAKGNNTNKVKEATITIKNDTKIDAISLTQEMMSVDVPDLNFKTFLLEKYDTNKDGIVSQYEADLITKMDCSGRNINSLQGLEQFTTLTNLNCSNNVIDSLDVSVIPYLAELNCEYNRMEQLTINNSNYLFDLKCGHNRIKTLNVSGNSKLRNLSFGYNPLVTIDISNCYGLTSFDCSKLGIGSIEKIIATKCTGITSFKCGYNKISFLDLTGCSEITSLDCCNNQLVTLDLSSCRDLTELICNDNKLTSISIDNCTYLTFVNCAKNNFQSLDFTNNLMLTDLWCANNYYLEKLSLSKRPSNIFQFEEWGTPIEQKREEYISGYYISYYYYYPRIYIDGVFSSEIYKKLIAA